jgi:hypothetical protein
MEKAMFFERIHGESVEQAPSREAHHVAPLSTDSNMLEPFGE